MRSFDDVAKPHGLLPQYPVVKKIPVYTVAEGIMPGHTDGRPRFASRADGIEAGVVAGTVKITHGHTPR